MSLTLCLLGNFSRFFCRLLTFSKITFFLKILSGVPSECQTVWILIRPDVLSGLIWVQTVCKGYQQTILFTIFASCKSTFLKNSFRSTIRVSKSLDPDQARRLSGLIWVQTVCKGYQQTMLFAITLPIFTSCCCWPLCSSHLIL